MSKPLSSSARRSMRKELVRLRMEMHRQQLRYHAQPLIHPLQGLKQLGNRKSSAKTPLMVGAAFLLSVFGKRLGMAGRLLRIGLAVYPVVRSLQAARGDTKLEKHR